MAFDLLLTHADDHRPVLTESLPFTPSARELPPAPPTHSPHYLWDPGGDPNALPSQRWGVVVPRGSTGKRLLSLIEPLRKSRQDAQHGAPPPIYEVPPGMSSAESREWKERVLRDESVPEEDQPRYLLILGDLHEVSLELQQTLATDTFVGRLAFRDEHGYAAYVDKVLRWERTPTTVHARALFFTANDGTSATRTGHAGLVSPSLTACRTRQQAGSLPLSKVLDLSDSLASSPTHLLEQAAVRHPSLLLSMSHGLGAPKNGWRSVAEQRALQGAMGLGAGQHLRAPDVASRPFLPGGIWLYVACFGAGTPATSSYAEWLRLLQSAGAYPRRVENVLASLPRQGEAPFIAALPQAALANPDGPLAVIGHVDLAWTCGYHDLEAGRARPSRFISLLGALLKGHRTGIGLGALLRFATEANAELLSLDDRRESASGTAATRGDVRALRGYLWMRRQDLSAYLLLGDPAVRMPVAAARASAEPSAPVLDPSAILGMPVSARKTPGAHVMEEAVLALLRANEPPEAIAARLGVSLPDLRDWERRYREAGRTALSRL
jgi:hypothetical protein